MTKTNRTARAPALSTIIVVAASPGNRLQGQLGSSPSSWHRITNSGHTRRYGTGFDFGFGLGFGFGFSFHLILALVLVLLVLGFGIISVVVSVLVSVFVRFCSIRFGSARFRAVVDSMRCGAVWFAMSPPNNSNKPVRRRSYLSWLSIVRRHASLCCWFLVRCHFCCALTCLYSCSFSRKKSCESLTSLSGPCLHHRCRAGCCCCCCCCYQVGLRASRGYFVFMVAGYAVGLLMANMAVYVMAMGQVCS